jgi:hypothetical protein
MHSRETTENHLTKLKPIGKDNNNRKSCHKPIYIKIAKLDSIKETQKIKVTL